MDVLHMVIILCVFAAAFFLVWKYGPANELKTFLLAAIAILLIIWLGIATGVWGSLGKAS